MAYSPMRGLGAALMALVSLAPLSQGAVLSMKIGPLAVHGEFAPMKGPEKTIHLHFPRPGWLLGYSVHVIDANGKAADDRGVLCHASVLSGGGRFADKPAERVFVEPLFMLVESGQAGMNLPDGFGVPVDSTTDYRLVVQLQNRDPANEGDYAIQADLRVAYQDEGAALKPLREMAVFPEDPTMHPGRHELKQEFLVPYSGTIHFAKFHIHDYVDTLSLVESRTGKVLFDLPVKNDASGRPIRIPQYSSVEGLPLLAGKRYEFVETYTNPREDDYDSMALMRLYVSPIAPNPRVALAK